MATSVTTAKYRTCICGKVCKGGAALANHGRTCSQESARSTAFVDAIERGDWTDYNERYAEARRTSTPCPACGQQCGGTCAEGDAR